MKILLIVFSLLSILFFLTSCNIFHPFQNHYTCDIYKDAIYLINIDGSNLTKVVDLDHSISTYWESIDMLPGAYIKFTPDGNKLIYITSSYVGYFKIYSVKLDGTDNTLLANNFNFSIKGGQPSLSSVESKIIFPIEIKYSVDYTDRFYDIYMVNDGAPGLSNLTDTYEIDEMYPCFLPNGEDIIYSSIDHRNTEKLYSISKLNINNGQIDTLIQNNEYAYKHLVISPDETKIYFITHINHSQPFFVINLDGTGTNQIQLYDDINIGSYLSLSLDGSKIVYNDYHYLYIMNTDGSGINQIETSLYYPCYPTFAQGGTRILYSGTSINDSIYTINTNGSNKKTINEGFMPTLSPDDNKIAFSGYYFYETVDYWE